MTCVVARSVMYIHLCIMWCLWEETLDRNSRCFEDRECSLDELKRFLFSTLLPWASFMDCNGANFQ